MERMSHQRIQNDSITARVLERRKYNKIALLEYITVIVLLSTKLELVNSDLEISLISDSSQFCLQSF